MKASAGHNRLRDLCLYVLIALGVAAFGVLYGIHAARTGGAGRLPLRWIGLASSTAIAFWYAVSGYRRYWRRWSFWTAVGIVLLVQLCPFAIILLRVPQWPLLWFVPTSFVQCWVLGLALDWFVHRSQGGSTG
jgi:hypothetical protein